ncbi:MAG: DinB family protein [Planctomycetota bacterium]
MVVQAINPIIRLHQHRNRVNHKLCAFAIELTNEQRHQSFGIGQGSVWKTLLHMMGAEYVWLETILGDANPTMPGDVPTGLVGNQRGENGIRTMDQLLECWTHLESRWNNYLEDLEHVDLNQLIPKISTSSHFGQRKATSMMDILLHVCTHAHYTAAQVINMLRQLGIVELPDPMLITMARDET